MNLTGVPETMAVRAKLLPENGLISQIAMSAMDNWGGEIKEQAVLVLVIIERNYWIETFHKTTEKDFPVPKAALAPDKDAGERGRVLRFLFEAEAVSRSGEENYEILGVWHRTPGADGDSARRRNLLPCG